MEIVHLSHGVWYEHDGQRAMVFVAHPDGSRAICEVVSRASILTGASAGSRLADAARIRVCRDEPLDWPADVRDIQRGIGLTASLDIISSAYGDRRSTPLGRGGPVVAGATCATVDSLE